MRGQAIPNDNHVIHYVKPRNIRPNGEIKGIQFILRKTDSDGLSANWLEYYSNSTKCEQVEKVKSSFNLRIEKKSCFAEFNVGNTKSYIREECANLNFIHDPTEKNDKHNADPSHSLIIGLPAPNSPESAMIGDMLAECVKVKHWN